MRSTGRLRVPLKIHFGGRANLFLAGPRQTKAALSTDKADLSFLPASKNLLLAAQKQLLELPFIYPFAVVRTCGSIVRCLFKHR